MKECVECGVEKPTSDFYLRPGKWDDGIPSSYYSYCKSCQKLKSRQSNKYNSDETSVDSESLLIERLLDIGIFASTGKYISAKHVDVVAWGCVWIEVKYTSARWNFRGDGAEFRFQFSPVQKKRLNADLIALICEWKPSEYTIHLFDATNPIFYKDGILKSTVAYQYGRPLSKSARQFMTQPMMDEAQDRWDMIGNYAALDPRRRIKAKV